MGAVAISMAIARYFALEKLLISESALSYGTLNGAYQSF